MGTLVDRVHRELSDEDIAKIAGTYHAWRGDKGAGKYEDVAGFCKAAKLDEIRKHGHVLTPGRYVGAEEVEDDGEPFEEKMKRLTATVTRAANRSHGSGRRHCQQSQGDWVWWLNQFLRLNIYICRRDWRHCLRVGRGNAWMMCVRACLIAPTPLHV